MASPRKPESEKVKTGRPEDYTPEKAALLCEEIACGLSVRAACRKHDALPEKQTIFRWMWRHPEFRTQYIHAKQLGMDSVSEDALDIADEGSQDFIEVRDKEGNLTGHKVDQEHIQRSRLRVDTRKWFMERLAPHYAAHNTITHDVAKDSPLAALVKSISGATLRPGGEDDSEQ